MQRPTSPAEAGVPEAVALAAAIRERLQALAQAWQRAASVALDEPPAALLLQSQHAALLSSVADDLEQGGQQAGAALSALLPAYFDSYRLAQELQVLRAVLTAPELPQAASAAHAQVDALLLAAARHSQSRHSALRATYQPILGHDIKSPLAAISMSASYLARTLQDPKQSGAIARIQRSAADLGNIVRNLYDFTHQHLLQGLQVSLAEADLLAVCEGAIAQQQKLHPEVRYALDCRSAEPGQYDAERIRQLLGSALHFLTGENVRHVWVELQAEAGHARLSVKADQAVPQHQHLQALFSRKPLGSTDVYRLTPSQELQFHLIQDIVTAHGGDIRITTLDGTSSSIEFSLHAALGG